MSKLSIDRGIDARELEALAAFSREDALQIVRLKSDDADGLDAFLSERDQTVTPRASILESPGSVDWVVDDARLSRRPPQWLRLSSPGMIVAMAAAVGLGFWIAVAVESSRRSPMHPHEAAVPPAASFSTATSTGTPAADPLPSTITSAPRTSRTPVQVASSLAVIAPAQRVRPDEVRASKSSAGTTGRATPPTLPTGRIPVVALPLTKSNDQVVVTGPAPSINTETESAAALFTPVPRPPAPVLERRGSTSGAEASLVADPAPAVPPPGERMARAVPRDEDEVRHVLSRYQSAYDRLDARSAKEIWPSLNERALARAFEGLQSQDVAFSACRLDVSGSRAQASCSGTARYVQRVGSKRSQQEARQWTFKLSKESNAWTIDSVQTR